MKTYDTIDAAIKAEPNCTHVMTTGPAWGYDEFKNEYLPAIKSGGEFYEMRDELCGLKIGPTGWVVAQDRTAINTAVLKPSDQQVGGDHYKSLKIQPIEYIDANNIPYLEGNVIKYVTRHASKNGLQDIEKAIHYLELIKQYRYGETNDE